MLHLPAPRLFVAIILNLIVGQAMANAPAPAFSNCSSAQEAVILSASEQASQQLPAVITDLTNLAEKDRAKSPRYTKWFGEYEKNRYKLVLNNFKAIENVLTSGDVSYHCSCEIEPVPIAYAVFATQEIHFCPRYFEDEDFAHDFVHELAHLDGATFGGFVPGVTDYSYTDLAVRLLAISTPDAAVINADSYAFFSQNALADPMLNDGTIPTVSDYPEIPVNTTVEGRIEQGESFIFRTLEADRVVLTSITGDADLLVYNGFFPDVKDSLLCSSNNHSDLVDTCDPQYTDRVQFVEVTGHRAADYTLQVIGDPFTTEPLVAESLADGYEELALDELKRGHVEQGESALYQVVAADYIDISSESGDADLAVYSSPERQEEYLLCRSSERSEYEFCTDEDIRGYYEASNSAVYVEVTGYTAADYTLGLWGSSSGQE
ncbi:MAG: M35 family metallo-endopeptidase [Granulosicoccus sp.]